MRHHVALIQLHSVWSDQSFMTLAHGNPVDVCLNFTQCSLLHKKYYFKQWNFF